MLIDMKQKHLLILRRGLLIKWSCSDTEIFSKNLRVGWCVTICNKIYNDQKYIPVIIYFIKCSLDTLRKSPIEVDFDAKSDLESMGVQQEGNCNHFTLRMMNDMGLVVMLHYAWLHCVITWRQTVVNSSRPCDSFMLQYSKQSLVQIMACRLFYLNQCCFTVNSPQCHPPGSNFTVKAQTIILYSVFEKYTRIITATSPRAQ